MDTAHRRPGTAPRLGASAALALALTLGAAGCGHEDDAPAKDTATDAATPSTGTGTATATATTTGRDYPDFAPQDYTYRLEVLCYCPQIGAVRVTVEKGEVVSARAITGRSKGAEAPDFARLSINDLIERANDPKVDEAEVTWPDGQDHPSVIALDQLVNAVDDEVTYTIRNVRLK